MLPSLLRAAFRCAIGYKDNSPKNPLVVVDKGIDIEDFTALCTADTILYALIRVVSKGGK